MRASNLAGKAINITATTAPHAMSYKITTMYNIPHGHAVAICLPAVWRYMINNTNLCVDVRGKEYIEKTLQEIPVSLKWFEKLLEELQINKPKSTNKSNDIRLLVSSVNSNRLKNNPIELDEHTIYELYKEIII
jgi:alcohol dehydrogenase class IV